MKKHQADLQNWIHGELGFSGEWIALVPDASFRRYFRFANHQQTYVVMDASQDPESCLRFSKIAYTLRQHEIHAPQIIAHEPCQGWMILEDLGDQLFLKQLQNQPNLADFYYSKALAVIAKLQTIRVASLSLPIFDQAWVWQEWLWFKEWVLQKALGIQLNVRDEEKYDLVWREWGNQIQTQARVFMHRDFHSQNILCLPDESLGILDFQDAFEGPYTYDVVSLLYDCYIDWDDRIIQNGLYYFYELSKSQIHFNAISFSQFELDIRRMSIQRHCKAIMTFIRKKIRDGDDRYLQYLPRTLSYLQKSLSQEKNAFSDFFLNEIIDKLNHQMVKTCVR